MNQLLTVRTDKRRSDMLVASWIAAIASLIMPGVAHAYYDRLRRAVVLWFAAAASRALALLYFPRWSGYVIVVLTLFAIAVSIWIALDAARISRAAATQPVPSTMQRMALAAGFLLAVMSVGALVRPAFRPLLGEAYRIPTAGMEPTILKGDYLMVLPTTSARVRHGSLVTYRMVQDSTKFLLKRIVGLAGDTLSMHLGQLQVNGKTVEEPYIEKPTGEAPREIDVFAWQRAYLVPPADTAHVQYHPTSEEWGPLIVPSGHIFALGDNRRDSYDSRYSGFIPVANIVGSPRRIYFSRDPDAGRIRWHRIGMALP